MRVVIASDKFRGTLTSGQANAAMAAGVLDAVPTATVDCREVADGDRLARRTQQRLLPGDDHRQQLVADRAGPVVVFDRAADVHAPAVDLARVARHPARIHRGQAWQAAGLLQARQEHLVLEAAVVVLDDRDLQVLARAEVREHAALRHLHAVGDQADRQPLEPVAAREIERGIEDRGTGLFAFAHGTWIGGLKRMGISMRDVGGGRRRSDIGTNAN